VVILIGFFTLSKATGLVKMKAPAHKAPAGHSSTAPLPSCCGGAAD
jgi:hypothetical protein